MEGVKEEATGVEESSGGGMSAPATGVHAAKDKIAAKGVMESDSPTPPSIIFYKPFNEME